MGHTFAGYPYPPMGAMPPLESPTGMMQTRVGKHSSAFSFHAELQINYYLVLVQIIDVWIGSVAYQDPFTEIHQITFFSTLHVIFIY